MNFSFYLFGTPTSGFDQYPWDNNKLFFHEISQRLQAQSQLTIYRNGRLVYYAYSHKLSSVGYYNYFGICLVFNGTYCRNNKQLFELFETTYSDVVLNGKILQIDKSGKISFATDQFIHREPEIQRIKFIFEDKIEGTLSKDFVILTSAVQVGNGAKTLFANAGNDDILSAVQHYDRVLILSDEKSESELDRIHKMLSELYTEKQHLNKEYKKLLWQKKQFKSVIFLCIAIIGCISGLVVFNRNLQSKENKLKSLETELKDKEIAISNQLSKIANLQIEGSKKRDTISSQFLKIDLLEDTLSLLKDEVYSLNETIKAKSETVDREIADIRTLNSRISALNLENNSLKRDSRDLTSQYNKLNLEMLNAKNSISQKYKVIAQKSYCYRQCGGTYYNNDCFYSLGAVVDVYTQRDGYALTIGGYLKIGDLQKY